MEQTNDLKSRIDMNSLKKNRGNFDVSYNAKRDILFLQLKNPPPSISVDCDGLFWLRVNPQNGEVRVVLTSGGEKKELDKIEQILRLCRTKPVSVAGKTTLKQLAALSQRCKFFIGVDTAAMHIAAAVGTPVIALFGPSGEVNWGPWGNGHVVIKRDFECRPCGKDGCQGSKRSRCLEEISEEEVLETAFHFLPSAEKSGAGGVF